MAENTREKVSQGTPEAAHKDGGRTIVESGAAAAAGLKPRSSKADVPVSQNPTANKVNAGSSDR